MGVNNIPNRINRLEEGHLWNKKIRIWDIFGNDILIIINYKYFITLIDINKLYQRK